MLRHSLIAAAFASRHRYAHIVQEPRPMRDLLLSSALPTAGELVEGDRRGV